jgi:MFS transporter, PPP family, 3-phenylpropionic acid transporter
MPGEFSSGSPGALPAAPGHAGGWTTGLLLKSFYFFLYGTLGCYLVFFGPYLRGIGFSGEQLGLIVMAGQIAGLISTLVWAAIADRLQAASRALRWCSLLASVSILLLPWARTPLQVGAVLVVHNLAAPALMPLSDAVAVEWLQRRGAGSYSRTRLFGTVGGVLLVQGLGSLLSSRGEQPGDLATPLWIVACVVAFTIVAQMLPFAPPSAPPPELRDVRSLGKDSRLRLLLLVCLVHWLCYTPYDLLFGIYLRDQGLPSSFNGLGLAGGPVAEILVLAAFPVLERRLRVGSLLALIFAGTALRWALLSGATTAWAIAGLQFLHGAMSGLFWATVVKAMSDIVPSRLRATGYALFSAIVVSGGNTLGYRLAGLGYDKLGARPLFGYAAVLEVVPLLLVLAVGRRLTARQSSSALEG